MERFRGRPARDGGRHVGGTVVAAVPAPRPLWARPGLLPGLPGCRLPVPSPVGAISLSAGGGDIVPRPARAAVGLAAGDAVGEPARCATGARRWRVGLGRAPLSAEVSGSRPA